MQDYITDFIHANYSPVTAQTLLGILDLFINIYNEYDDTILETVISDEDATLEQKMDDIRVAIRVDTTTVLLLHGIVTTEDACDQTLYLLLRLVATIADYQDKEDAQAILSNSDPIEAVVQLALELADTAPPIQSYNINTVLTEIERVEPFIIQKMKELLSDEPISVNLGPEVRAFVQAFPDSIISELLSQEAGLFPGGSIDLYTRIFKQYIEQLPANEVAVLITGILIISGVSSTDYMDITGDILTTYFSPDVQMRITRDIHTCLMKVAHITA